MSLPQAIFAAHRAGFDAVETHSLDLEDIDAVKAALDTTGLPLQLMNTGQGAPGEIGFNAIPGREAEARADIDKSIAIARRLQCDALHLLAGFTDAPAADTTFRANLDYACDAAARHDMTILIEPLNQQDMPGYFLSHADYALALIDRMGHPNLKLIFDCYHVQIMDGDLSRRITALLPLIGHVQIASVPDRGPPDEGEVNYRHICRLLDSLGWNRPLGVEYIPVGLTEETLGWMQWLRES
ncbi:hydroxypyruvate isomerase family protein [Paracoccus pacificus]|uniref:Hydroxypyruvate isomerase family protein n=1 Tax=Paracoccus pacificus TaxID=1463598 RepID=A0ABW4R4E1_9RHOB